MIEFWHNARCSKSREALRILREAGVEPQVRSYLEQPPTRAELVAMQARLGLPAIDMMRVKDAAFREAGLSCEADDATLLDAMAGNPALIERPVISDGTRAVIGRPPERALEVV